MALEKNEDYGKSGMQRGEIQCGSINKRLVVSVN